jgi:hypothetical protein
LVNQAPVAGYCAEILKQINDGVAALRSVMAAVTNTTDVSSAEAIESLIGVALLDGPGVRTNCKDKGKYGNHPRHGIQRFT